ncbi:MAG: alpha/beta hydrolase fold domain-containing protein [Eubacterium sp.]|nr:alpha/beta hydrolase fold domain-containing protein [Eubacterium sp.]
MPRRHREKLCPEITDPQKRVFLDLVPVIRRLQKDILDGQALAGEKVEIPLQDRIVPVYLHRAEKKGQPVVFQYHGGGYVFGSAVADDGFCETLCRLSGCNVIGVEYRLAPEVRYPAQLEDAWEVLCWIRKHAEEYDLDADRIAVTGFSAGANLAAAVALKAAAERAGWMKAQILHYPFLDFRLDLEKEAKYEADVDPIMVHGFLDSYCEDTEREIPFVSPVCAGSDLLNRTAPVLLIPAERDRLRNQALCYEEALRVAGTEVRLYTMPEAHHCYVEDACNPELYDKTTLPATKKLHSPDFRKRAEQAVQMTADFLQEHFSAGKQQEQSITDTEHLETKHAEIERSNAMGNVLDPIYEKAKQNPQRVVFPEGTNEKMMQAAYECARDGYIKAILIGNAAELKQLAEERGYDTSVFTFIDMEDEAYLDKIVAGYLAQEGVFLSEKGLRRRAKKPLYYAMIMQRAGEAEVTFAGIDYTTRDVLLAGQEVIGLKPGISTISSIGLCDIPGFEGSEGQLLAIGDSAVCTNPDPEQLADIAISACGTVQELLGWEPRCAMVCYSTLGSGNGPLIDKVTEALRIAQEKRPDLAIDGEFQLDAAIVPAVAAKKVNRESKVAGKANVVIWPDLNVGNVGVKLIQQFGHADAYGPMLQGFNKIVCDCSRGAPVSELKGNIIMSAVRAAASK